MLIRNDKMHYPLYRQYRLLGPPPPPPPHPLSLTQTVHRQNHTLHTLSLTLIGHTSKTTHSRTHWQCTQEKLLSTHNQTNTDSTHRKNYTTRSNLNTWLHRQPETHWYTLQLHTHIDLTSQEIHHTSSHVLTETTDTDTQTHSQSPLPALRCNHIAQCTFHTPQSVHTKKKLISCSPLLVSLRQQISLPVLQQLFQKLHAFWSDSPRRLACPEKHTNPLKHNTLKQIHCCEQYIVSLAEQARTGQTRHQRSDFWLSYCFWYSPFPCHKKQQIVFMYAVWFTSIPATLCCCTKLSTNIPVISCDCTKLLYQAVYQHTVTGNIVSLY